MSEEDISRLSYRNITSGCVLATLPVERVFVQQGGCITILATLTYLTNCFLDVTKPVDAADLIVLVHYGAINCHLFLF